MFFFLALTNYNIVKITKPYKMIVFLENFCNLSLKKVVRKEKLLIILILIAFLFCNFIKAL